MARNFLMESQAIAKAQQRSIYVLGWASAILALAGGAFAAEAWPGNLIAGFLGWFPDSWALPNILLIVGAVAVFIDVINDMTPNMPFLAAASVGPSVATAGNGGFAGWVSDSSSAMQGWLGPSMGDFAGSASASVLAIIAVACAFLVGRRVLSKQRAARMG